MRDLLAADRFAPGRLSALRPQPVYEDLPAELRERIEDGLFNRRADAGERLLEVAS